MRRQHLNDARLEGPGIGTDRYHKAREAAASFAWLKAVNLPECSALIYRQLSYK